MNRGILFSILVAALVPFAAFGTGLGVFASYWDADSTTDPGMGGGVKLQMDMSPAVVMELRGSYFSKFEDGTPTEDFTVIPGEAAMITKMPMGSPAFQLYMGGGAGYYFTPEFDTVGPVVTKMDPKDEIGYFALGGLELQFSRSATVFAEAKYNWLEIDEVKVDGVTVDLTGSDVLDLSGFNFNAGLQFKF